MWNKVLKFFIILTLLIIFGLTFIWSISLFIVKKEVVVPNVVNMNLKSAQRLLKEHHLRFVIEGNDIGSLRKNKIKFTNVEILNQFPHSGERILKKFKISLFIRIIEETTKVPCLIGLDSVNAKFEIENSDLSVGEISYVRSKVNLRDKVIYQEPIAGTSVNKGSTISYSINSGILKKYVLVPYFMNNDLEYVKPSIEQLGLILGNNPPSGEIVSQSLIPGDIVSLNSPIVFDVIDKSKKATRTKIIPVNTSINKKKFYIINYTFSSFMGSRRGKVYVSYDGKREQLLNKNIKAGYNFRKLITYGNNAKVEIYLDGKKIFTKELK
ncbi:PASTA domain-containing protein [bacterium]|nr:PASTA domain-containing protein [bacterium]